MNNIENIVFESMLQKAVTSNLHNKIKAMPPEEELLQKYPPSAEHIRKMKSLFFKERRMDVMKKLRSFTKAAVLFLCIATTFLFAVLMFNPHVRAAVRDTFVQFFEGFTRIEFNNHNGTIKDIQSFNAKYIPEGYVQTNVEDYGDSRLIIYVDEGGNMLMLNIGFPDLHTGDVDNRDYRIEVHEHISYHIFEAYVFDDFSNVTWIQEGFMFNLTGAASVEELLKIAWSLE